MVVGLVSGVGASFARVCRCPALGSIEVLCCCATVESLLADGVGGAAPRDGFPRLLADEEESFGLSGAFAAASRSVSFLDSGIPAEEVGLCPGRLEEAAFGSGIRSPFDPPTHAKPNGDGRPLITIQAKPDDATNAPTISPARIPWP